VTIHDQGEDRRGLFLVMEYAAGGSLGELLSGGRALSPTEIVRIGAEIAEGLGHAHSRGVVHRDVKPANILLTPERRAKISDFGIARLAGRTTEAEASEIVGTPLYMSGEQLRGERVGPESDVYSLGVVLYQMTAGKLPFSGDTLAAISFAILHEPVPDLPAGRLEAIPPRLQAVIGRALAKKPSDRFSSAEEMARELRGALPREPGSPPS
jgi:serine/threonine-protein kinase